MWSSKLALTALTLLSHFSECSASAHSSVYLGKLLTRTADVRSEYDYVVVGGGTAGLTVADRLTEDGRYSVLVIEYGLFDNSSSVSTVYRGNGGISNSSHLFSLLSVPQPGLYNRSGSVVVGKLLGGSSAVNGMQVQRGQKEDYDRWASYFGTGTEWTWDDILPYFKKAWRFHPPVQETATALNITYDTSFWGNTSNIHASFPTFNWPMLRTEIEAFRDISGVEFPRDSGAGRPGVFWYPASAEPANATRSHSRTGHLDWIHRSNYEFITDFKALKVLFNEKTATGVMYASTRSRNLTETYTVKARKEVIIAAGTIHTPQILQASGVGPKAVLDAANVTVVVDLPGVGQNFQDHPLPTSLRFTFDNFTMHPNPNDILTNTTFIAQAQAEFAANRTGPYVIASGNAAAFLPFPIISPDKFEAIAKSYESQEPAAYLPAGYDKTLISGYAAQKASLAKAMRSTGIAFYNLFLLGGPGEGAIVMLHPLSRGTININPADPYFSEPIIDYRALSNPADVQVMIEFTRFTRRYMKVPSLAIYQPRETTPGINVTSDADLEDFLRRTLSPTTYHPVGTSAMMPLELGGVVDQKLLVYGVEKLSVVDASIMPNLPGAYTQQSVYAIAEKAAALIKARQ